MISKGEKINPNLGDRLKHPANKAVETPQGRFPSAIEAARALEISRWTVYRRIKAKPGWKYVEASNQGDENAQR